MAQTELLKSIIHKAGGVRKVCERLKVYPSAVSQWVDLPPRHIKAFSDMTGLPAHELRPDLIDAPETMS